MPQVLPRLIFKEDENDVSSQKTPPHTPFPDTALRTSNRRLGTKRSYEGMQSRRRGSRKKFKYTIKEVDCFRDAIDESTNSDAAKNARAEIIKELGQNATSAGSSINSCPLEKPLNNSLTAETTALEMTAMSAKDDSNAGPLSTAKPPLIPSRRMSILM
jgi:hypothetical protein